MTIPSMLHRPHEDLYTFLGVYNEDTQKRDRQGHRQPLDRRAVARHADLVLGTVVAAWPDAAETRVMDTEIKRLSVPPSSAGP